ncbi:hypothetical protein [Dactylosporangium sp. NPDC051541]|uniref:hypothetical protein n=1 Tax=Dactylosporangium sp. NPDC051541 TaxID=3363977 RepID=UPI00379FB616
MAENLIMDVQLDVDASGGPFADLMYRWIDEGSELVRPLFRSGLTARTALTGAPGEPFGTIRVHRRRVLAHPWSPGGLDWLRAEVGRGRPDKTDLYFGVRDAFGHESGQVLVINAAVKEQSPGWLKLSGHPLVDGLLDPHDGPAEQRRWLDALLRFADTTNPGFGHVSPYYAGGTTALEHAFPPATMPFEARYQEYALNECRTYLRGYSWVTIVAEDLLPRLGGIDRLRDSRAFADVRQLTAGGVWLQATEDYRDFDDAAIARVFEALAPALRPGLPRRFEPHYGQNPHRLVFRDAADLGAR